MIGVPVSILDRYLFKEFLGPFFLAVGGFLIIGIVDILFYLVDLTVSSGVPFQVVLELLFYKIPAIMVLFFPMAVLFSSMLLLIRLAKDNELTVLRTSGVHTARILIPIAIVMSFTSVLSYLLNEKVVPWTNERSDVIIDREIRKKPPLEVMEDVVFKVGSDRFFHAKKVNTLESTVQELLILEGTIDFPRVITAKRASFSDNRWTLFDGYIQELNYQGSIQFMDKYDELSITLPEEARGFYEKTKSPQEMDSSELKARIDNLNKGGVSTRSLKVEYYLKQSMPVACFIFGSIGLAFSLSFVRSGKDWWGVIASICTSVLSVGFYFFILAVCRSLGKNGTISPFLGAWTPNFLYGFVALVVISYQCKYR